MKAPFSFSDVHRVRSLKVALALFVAVLQLGLFALLGLATSPAPVLDVQTPVDVTLVRHEAVIKPVPEVVPRSRSGGGSPTAPSVIRQPSIPPDREVELVAPPVPASIQPVIVGLASETDLVQAQGRGSDGESMGEGRGDGSGPGRGGSPPMILRGATRSEIMSVVPQSARRARQAGRTSISCVIRLDETLDDCRIVSESPSGFGFGEAGLQASRFFRYRPPSTASGRPVEGQRVTISVLFGRQ